MPDIADRRIFPTSVTGEGYALTQAGNFLLGQPGRVLSEAECRAIPKRYQALGVLVGVDWTIAFAQACVETNNFRFGKQVPLQARNPAGIGAINDGRSYLSYPDWDTGILAYYVHLLAWCDRLDLAPRLTSADPAALDPRLPLVATARAVKGAATTWRSLGGRWAVREGIDWRQQATMAGNYGAGIAARYAAIRATPANTGGAMKVTDYPSPNFGYPQGEHGRSGNKVVALVIHVMDGSLTGTRSWFASPASQASANRGLGRDGVSMDRYVQEGDAPWTNGDIQGPDLSIAWLRDAIARGLNPNELTETLECEGRSGEPWPEAQYQGILQWVRDRTAALGIAPNRDNVIGHYRLNSVTRANCPGKNFPWDRLFHDLGAGFNLPDAGKSLMLKAAWAKGRQLVGEAGLPDPYGLMQYEAVADLSGIVATLPKAARCLVCEKAVLWVGGAGAIDTFHRGQYEALETAGKATKLV